MNLLQFIQIKLGINLLKFIKIASNQYEGNRNEEEYIYLCQNSQTYDCMTVAKSVSVSGSSNACK